MTELFTPQQLLESKLLQEAEGVEGSVSAQEAEDQEKKKVLRSFWEKARASLFSGEFGTPKIDDKTFLTLVSNHIKKTLHPDPVYGPVTSADTAVQSAIDVVNRAWADYQKQQALKSNKAGVEAAMALPDYQEASPQEIAAAVNAPPGEGQADVGSVEYANRMAKAKEQDRISREAETEYVRKQQGIPGSPEKSPEFISATRSPRRVWVPPDEETGKEGYWQDEEHAADLDWEKMVDAGARPNWKIFIKKENAKSPHYFIRTKTKKAEAPPEDEKPIGKIKKKDPKTGQEIEVPAYTPTPRAKEGWRYLDPSEMKLFERDTQVFRDRMNRPLITYLYYKKAPNKYRVLVYAGGNAQARDENMRIVHTGSPSDCQKIIEDLHFQETGQKNEDAPDADFDVQRDPTLVPGGPKMDQWGAASTLSPAKTGRVVGKPEFTIPEPEGGWATDVNYDEVNKIAMYKGQTTAPYFLGKTPEQIEALKIDPRQIDPKIAQVRFLGNDPKEAKRRRQAILAKIALARKETESKFSALRGKRIEGSIEEPEGGFDDTIDYGQVNDIKFLNNKPGGPIERFPTFFSEKTPEEIMALRIDPRNIDPILLQDPALSAEQKNAIRHHMAKLRSLPKISNKRDIDPVTGELQGDRPRTHTKMPPGMTGTKSVPDKDRPKKMVRVPDTDLPPIGYTSDGTPIPMPPDAIAPAWDQARKEIAELTPILKNFIKSFSKYAGFAQKGMPLGASPVTVLSKNPKTGKLEKVPQQLTTNDVSMRERCANCNHPAKDHMTNEVSKDEKTGAVLSDKSSLMSCKHPNCQTTEDYAPGKSWKVSKCTHFVPSGKLIRSARMKSPASADTVMDILDDLEKMQSAPGSIGSGDVPYDDDEIMRVENRIELETDPVRKKELEDELKDMRDENAFFESGLDKDILSLGFVTEEDKPFTYEELITLRNSSPEKYAKAQKMQRTWQHMMRKQAEAYRTMSSQLAIVTSFFDNIKGGIKDEQTDKAKKAVAGRIYSMLVDAAREQDEAQKAAGESASSEIEFITQLDNPEMRRIFNDVVTSILKDPKGYSDIDVTSKGSGEFKDPVTGKIKGTPGQFATGPLAMASARTHAPTPAQMVQQAKEDVATGYHKEGTPEWHRDQFLISLEDLTDDDAVKELNDMYREELETLQSSEVDPKTGQPIKKTWKDQLEIPTAAVTMLRQLTGALRGSGGRHTRAEHGYLDRRGSKVHHKGVDIPGKGKKGNKYTASFVDPTAPTVRPSRDISTVPDDEEGRRLPEIPLSAAEIGAKEVQAVSDEYRDRLERSKRAAKITGTVTRGAKADDKLPPLVKPARLRPTAPSEGPPELPPEAYDPESPEEKLRKKLADLKKQLMGVDTKLTEIARFSTADHTPNWYDDL